MIDAATVSIVGRERQLRGGDFVTSRVRVWADQRRISFSRADISREEAGAPASNKSGAVAR
jgi:hypothetical protein